MSDDKRPSSEEVGRRIDQAEPSEALKRAVAKDLEAHLPADMVPGHVVPGHVVPGQAAQEPLKQSQREAEDEAPGS